MAHCPCFNLRVWLYFSVLSPKIVAPIKTLKQVLIKQNYLLAFDYQMTEHKKGSLGRGVEG